MRSSQIAAFLFPVKSGQGNMVVPGNTDSSRGSFHFSFSIAKDSVDEDTRCLGQRIADLDREMW